jgi:hypothetical protein
MSEKRLASRSLPIWRPTKLPLEHNEYFSDWQTELRDARQSPRRPEALTARNQLRAFPSHGRGRRFNPYSAHHFKGLSRQYLATQNGTKREDDASTRGESVDFVLVWFRPNIPQCHISNALSVRAGVGVATRNRPRQTGSNGRCRALPPNACVATVSDDAMGCAA